MPIAPSTCYARLAERIDPSKSSKRTKRDAILKPEIKRVFEANYEVYGVCKIWRQMHREGYTVARCTVGRLMRGLGQPGLVVKK